MRATNIARSCVWLIGWACSADSGLGRATGRVVRHSGAEVPGARVAIGTVVAVTGSDGSFAVDGLAPGVHLARVSVADERPHAAPVTVVGGQEVLVSISERSEAGTLDLWLGGDVMFSRRMEDADLDGVLGDGLVLPGDEAEGAAAALAYLTPLLEDADAAVVNLETTVTDRGAIHPRKPYTLRSAPAVLEGLTAAGVDVVGLGNNHVYDYLDEGIVRMLELIDQSGLGRVGAGRDWDEATKPLIVERNGVKVGFIAATSVTGRAIDDDATSIESPPYYTADPPEETEGLPKAGTLRLDRRNVEAGISRAKALGCDLLVLIVHGGTQYSTEESDYIRQVAHFAIEGGVDLVVGHHPHVIQGIEVYRGVPIIYSVGNLVFDQQFVETFPALVVEARGRRGAGFERVAVRPIWLDEFRPRASGGPVADATLKHLALLSARMGTVLDLGRGGVAVVDLSSGPAKTRTKSLEAQLVAQAGRAQSRPVAVSEPGWFVAGVDAPAGVTVRYGRDLVVGGSFDDGGADDDLGQPLGFRIVGREKEIAAGVLRLRRTRDSVLDSTVRSVGRVRVDPGTLVTLIGQWRGDERAGTAVARIALYPSREAGIDPLGTAEIRTQAPGEWAELLVSITVPEGAPYLQVELIHEPPTRGSTGVIELDNVALIRWGAAPAEATHVALEAPVAGGVTLRVELRDQPQVEVAQ